MKEHSKDIVRNSVHSTKELLSHYLLDHFHEDDPNYSLVKQAVKDIYKFQDEILGQLDKEEGNTDE